MKNDVKSSSEYDEYARAIVSLDFHTNDKHKESLSALLHERFRMEAQFSADEIADNDLGMVAAGISEPERKDRDGNLWDNI